MGFQITSDSHELLFQETFQFDVEKMSTPLLIEETQQLKRDFGEATFREMYFDGCHIAVGDAQVYQNLHIFSSDNMDAVSLLFMVHGQVDTNIEGMFGIAGKRRFSTLEHNLIYNPFDAENADVIKQEDLEMVMLSFSKERFLELAVNNGRVLDGLADKVAGGKAIYLNKKNNQPITSRMLMILDEIKKCEFNGGLKKLYLQSKILELLALQCEQYERVTELRSSAGNTISSTDKEKIYYARDILLAQLQEPPSLQELSRLAGLNEFKLKSGFKQVFDNTVFGYLNDHRMEHARQLVLEGSRSLTDIADTFGYSSIQHFSNSFRKKYGVSPGKMR
ncbi:transcriptional regulator, AraC family [Chitinophaga sp. CF118]|uniref:helix-turn-helix transcriptional regulator n=1 Tax=Chitinophaga sp. CF118 TaxID=1884367 RepID=UPI0008E0CBBF|nr:AraC family transcriptional regulator [Chitinophaga sp. CF118]SFE88064.1 transcriptional regulator, AraC family [Chitinophaga sp. CF118]